MDLVRLVNIATVLIVLCIWIFQAHLVFQEIQLRALQLPFQLSEGLLPIAVLILPVAILGLVYINQPRSTWEMRENNPMRHRLTGKEYEPVPPITAKIIIVMIVCYAAIIPLAHSAQHYNDWLNRGTDYTNCGKRLFANREANVYLNVTDPANCSAIDLMQFDSFDTLNSYIEQLNTSAREQLLE